MKDDFAVEDCPLCKLHNEKGLALVLAHEFVVLGDPKAQKRHRHVRMGGFTRTYDPSKEEKEDYRVVAQQNAPDEPISQPMFIVVELFFTRPKAHYGTGKNADMLKSWAPMVHTNKPDKDNCDKFIMDALSKVFWTDDALIVGGLTLKHYSSRPRTEVKVFVVECEKI